MIAVTASNREAGPSWVYSEPYDIEAKAEGKPDVAQSRLMLQSLLADRFHLKLRRETRDLPMFALVRAGKDARPSAGLARAKEGSCARDQDFPPPQEAGRPSYCGVTQQLQRNNGASVMHLRGFGVPLGALARSLASTLNSHVADETGMAGNYDVSVDYAPYNYKNPFAQTDTAAPSLFVAIQQELGLKLVSRKGPVEILVVDHAERPTEN